MNDESGGSEKGSISWADLTTLNADSVRDFYAEVIGWSVEAVDMGEYSDYTMCRPADGGPVAGVCHARGVNADLPPQWLIYVNVDDADQAADRCRECGGTVMVPPRSMGAYRISVIQDPAGAVLAVISIRLETH